MTVTIDYDYGFISPVPGPLRHDPPRERRDVFNAWGRSRYNKNYREPGDPFGHGGVDLGPPWGVTVKGVAPAEGDVHAAGWQSRNPFAGNVVEMVHPSFADPEYSTRELHLARAGLPVKGQHLEQGERIGTISNTARPLTRWVHTHHEIRYLGGKYDPDVPMVRQGTPLDPLDFGILDKQTELELVEFTIMRPLLRVQQPPYPEDPAVQTLQYELNKLGLLNMTAGVNYDRKAGKFDGKFGPSTEDAVIAFQILKGLVADGIVGGVTWAVLLGY